MREAERTEKARLTQVFQRFAEVKFFGLEPRVQYVNVNLDAIVYTGHGAPTVRFIERRELGL